MMLAEAFLEEFGRLAAGAGSTRKLRELILNLAISGMLSDRRPEDGHAQALVDAAALAIRSALESGRIRKPRYFGKAESRRLPISLPANWVTTCLGDLGLISPRNDAADEASAGFVPMAEIEAKFGLPHGFEERKWADIKSGYTHIANGDVVLAKITPCFENGKSAAIACLPNGLGAGTTELHVFRQLTHVVEPDYVLAFLKSESFIQAGVPRMTGTAGQKRIPADYFALSPFPLPPLAEQKRIVANVNELMTLCDKLEMQQAEERELRRMATASALHHLTKAKTPEEIAGRWSLLVPRFDELFNDLETIKVLRRAILDVSIYGEAQSQCGREDSDEMPLSDFAISITDGDHQAPPKVHAGVPFLVISNIVGGSVEIEQATRFVPREYFDALKSERKPNRGDLLYTVTGSIGVPVIIDTDDDFCFQRHIAIIKPAKGSDVRYLQYALQSDRAKQQAYQAATGTAQKTIPLSGLRKLLIPRRKLTDQKRIVAKLDELMALCDRLEEQVREGERLSAELMATLVHSLTGADPDHGGMPELGGFAADTPTVFSQKQANTRGLGAPRFEKIRNASSLKPGIRLTSDRAPGVDTKFQEAVLVAAIVNTFFEAGGEPIGNFRLQKAVYFARRRMGEHVDEMAYLRKAAGPYNPSMKYSGGIAIAKQKNWLHEARGRYGFGHVPGADIADAGQWIATYRYDTPSRWVTEHFRYKKNEEWETLATVDYVIEHLQTLGIEPDPAQILQYIASDLEWRPKIEKLRLTEMSVATAKLEVQTLFSTEGELK